MHVLHRTRRKNGEWAKPKPAPVSAQEIDDLPELDDREIHAQLLGAVDQAALQASYYGQVQSERATYLLVNSSAARLLPRLVHTGRLHLTLERGLPEPDPLVWDDGLPWHFDLTIATDADGSIRVGRRPSAAMARGWTCGSPCCCSMPGSSRHASPLPASIPGDAFPWIAELRRSNSVTFPAYGGRLAGRSAGSRRRQAGTAAGAAAVRSSGDDAAAVGDAGPYRRARYADGYRDTLGAVLRFDYARHIRRTRAEVSGSTTPSIVG